MKILFVASRCPWPLVQGDRIRGYHQLRLLSGRHQVTLIAPVGSSEEEASLARFRDLGIDVHSVRVSTASRVAGLARGAWRSEPFQTLLYSDPRVVRLARNLAAHERFDVAHAQMVRGAPAIEKLSTARVVDLIDAMSLNMDRRAHASSGPTAALAAWEARRTLRYERELAARAEACLVVSDVDRLHIGGDRVRTIPLGVDTEQFQPRKKDDAPKIVFSGRLSYFPNADAALHFAADVLPLVRREVPDATFDVVGEGASPELVASLRRAGARVTGRVDSIADHVGTANVAVAPMRAGSGMQFKVLEAMSCATPIVVSPLATGGLNAEARNAIRIASTSSEMASSVVQLLRDPAGASDLGRMGRRVVIEHYSWESSVRELERVYSAAVHAYAATM